MVNKPKPYSEAASVAQGDERRRSQRVILKVPVQVEYANAGNTSVVEAQTVAVNIHGAMLLCSRNFDAAAKLQIIHRGTRERVGARVTRAPRESSDGFLVPVEFDVPSPSFWQISFPESNWKPLDS